MWYIFVEQILYIFYKLNNDKNTFPRIAAEDRSMKGCGGRFLDNVQADEIL